MSRPIVLIHGYSASGLDFRELCNQLQRRKIDPIDINVGNYVSLNNEITIKDIAEGFDRALRNNPRLNAAQEFDAIVHSTGMLVIRSWLTNYGAAVGSNERVARLKHLVGLAPATWGSPQAHKGRTWIGALVKGNKEPGPDFMNAGDEVLDGLELGSRFTWDLSHLDLLGERPYYDKGPDTPYVCVFIGNSPYTGISSFANDPGTDGTVRWSGCSLNTRKITIDLTRVPVGSDGKPTSRVSITPWADRVEIPMIPVADRNHATLVSNPDGAMMDLICDFLKVSDEKAYGEWLPRAQAGGAEARKKMLVNPGKDAAGIGGEINQFFGHLFHAADKPMDGWQQFVVHARDERGDPVTDYLIDVLRQDEDGNWIRFDEMYTDVHAYGADQSFRCFHIRLPNGICGQEVPLRISFSASTGTALIGYQGYGSDDAAKPITETAGPVVINVNNLGDASLFYPFTTTLVEIVINREPFPLDKISEIFKFLENTGQTAASG
jgi:pimeloyl-ACP methyl ester carboxylesterase